MWQWIVKIWSIIGCRWCFECKRRMYSWDFSLGSAPGAASREFYCNICDTIQEDDF